MVLQGQKNIYKNSESFQLIGEGLYHFDNANYKGALASFNSVIDMDPNNIKAQFQKANTLSKLEKFDDAVHIYTNLLKASRSSDYINWVWESPRYKNIYVDLLSGLKWPNDNTNSFFRMELDSNKNIAIFVLNGIGESRLIKLNEEKVNEWEKQFNVIQRSELIKKPYVYDWKKRHGDDSVTPIQVTPRYLLIHALSHVLIRQLTFDCGYYTSALRERIYSSEGNDNMMFDKLLDPLFDSLVVKYSDIIHVDENYFADIDFTSIDMHVFYKEQSHSLVVPIFPITTTRQSVVYIK